ncbi:MAG TPA: tetratricopeptide repeat protein [Candidatus Hydrogenedentes bacterium]|nr:tetratricopeptide repeat protein [Candidatus Hydrogenedentota bacterium]HNT88682.1 tetratricopeptide repeat protein [Candidatus Hydrogenedentota bacterium]
MRLSVLLCLAACLTSLIADAAGLEDYRDRINALRLSYDAEGAEKLLPEVVRFAADHPDAEARELVARLGLLVAELLRYEHEKGDFKTSEKRALGDRIDEAARVAHEALDQLPETSEHLRMRADLWATMIRTNYQGKRFSRHMDNAAAAALAKGPDNPHAYVTASKRLVFAERKHGGDIDKGMAMLDKALALDPACESALVIRGLAHEEKGDLDKAREDWRRVLEINPACRPAQEHLDRLNTRDK